MSTTDARDDAFIAAIDEVRAERDEAVAERDAARREVERLRTALAMIGSPATWVRLDDVREYAREALKASEEAP